MNLRRTGSPALLALLLLFAGALPAEVSVPALSGRVVDLTTTLSAAESAAIDSRLAGLEQRKGSQIVVLLVPSVRPETIEQFSIRVTDAWKLGRKGIDDGVLLLIAKDDREARIEVGRGLEGVIPDATANRIIDEYLVPRFQAGDFAGGVGAAADRLIGLVDGEPLPPPEPRARGASPLENVLPLVFVVSLVVGGLLRRVLGQLPGAATTGLVVGALTWFLAGALTLALLMAVVGFFVGLAPASGAGRWASRGRGWPGGIGGGFGGGLGGGGGFGGGGGGFGGGGASGRW